MPTPRRRLPSATGAFFLAALLALAALPGCANRTGSSVSSRDGSASLPPPAPVFAAPLHLEVGRVLSLDAADRTAVIEFVPAFRPPPDLAGRALIARDPDTLAEKARLTAAPYQKGRFLGAYVAGGAPAPGDEVVLAP